jgi:hypothetical protein
MTFEDRRKENIGASRLLTVLVTFAAMGLFAVGGIFMADAVRSSGSPAAERTTVSDTGGPSPSRSTPAAGRSAVGEAGGAPLEMLPGPFALWVHEPSIPLDRSPERAMPRPEEVMTRASMREIGLEITVDEKRKVELPLESVLALPGDTVEITASVQAGGRLWITTEGDDPVRNRGRVTARWIAPATPGFEIIRIRHPVTETEARIHAFTMVPHDRVEGGRLNGYRIGSYPSHPLGDNPIYEPPPGFVEVTRENADVRVSPHFTLGQFPAKQSQAFPKYIVLRPLLLRKMEWVLEALADRGYPVRSFHVMSGYRTPFYNNHVLGNVQYSRHQWGGAADVFVDERPRNGMMDDLTNDGRITVADARVIHSVVDSLELDMGANFPVGGLGLYQANAVRGPFVHMDVRGTRARW